MADDGQKRTRCHFGARDPTGPAATDTLFAHLWLHPRDSRVYAQGSAPDRSGTVLAMPLTTMTTQPYRTAPPAESTARDHGCPLCRARAALAQVRLRSVLIVGSAVAFLMLNGASALVAMSSARLAEKMLSAATALDRTARAAQAHERAATHPMDSQVQAVQQAPTPPPGAPPRAHRPPPPASLDGSYFPSSWHFPEPHTWEGGILKISYADFAVDRRVVNRALEQQAELMGQTRIVPQQLDGKVVGVSIFGVRPNTLLGMLGFENGDTLMTINGLDIREPEAALEAYSKLRNASELSVRLKRRGLPLILRYHVR